MKVALVNPNLQASTDSPPTGLAILAAVLLRDSFDVQIVDFASGDKIDKLNKFAPDVVGVTGTTQMMNYAYQIADACRANGVYTVIGGVHASLFPNEAQNHADCVIVGEGEQVISDTFRARYRGVCIGKPLVNLDDAPIPAYHLLNMNYYTSLLSRVQISFAMIGPPTSKLGTMLTSRGCQMNCLFCLRGESLILTSDLRWIPLYDIEVGDEIVCIKQGVNGKYTKLGITKVKNKFSRTAFVYHILTENGSTWATAEHPWLTYHMRWRRTEQLTNKSVLRKISDPTAYREDTEDYKKGYLIGVMRGDGCFYNCTVKHSYGTYRYRHSILVGDDEMMDVFHEWVTELGFHYRKANFNPGKIYKMNRCVRLSIDSDATRFENMVKIGPLNMEQERGWLAGIYDAEGSWSQNVVRIANKNESLKKEISRVLSKFGFNNIIEKNGVRILGGLNQFIRFMSFVHPKVTHKRLAYNGVALKNRTRVINVVPVGNMSVYNLETEEGNFIADGFVTHNCHNSFRTLPFRFNSTARVMEEMKLLIDDYKIDALFYVEDNFFANRKRLLEICAEMKKEHIDLAWGGNSRVNNIDQTVLSTARSVGCNQVTFGWESGSQRILDILNKHATVEQNNRSIQLCNENNINASGTVMVGNPTETDSDIAETAQFLSTNNITGGIGVCLTTPYPGTGLWAWCESRGLLPRNKIDYSTFDFHHIPVNMTSIPAVRLQQWFNMLYQIVIRKFHDSKGERERRWQL